MLILTRKKNESIMIDDKVEIIITEIQDGKVKLGIKAPKEIEIHRKEIYLQIQDENKKAAKTNPNIDISAFKNIFKMSKEK